MKLAQWYNPFIVALLNSPLHPLLSQSFMVVVYRGRKSGRTYRVPVEYVVGDGYLQVFSRPDRVWWRNLKDKAPIVLRWRGREVRASAQIYHNDPELFGDALSVYLRRHPKREPFFRVTREGEGWNTEDLVRAAGEWVVIRLWTEE